MKQIMLAIRSATVTVILICLFYGFASAEDYIIGPGDVVRVTVYDNNDL